MGSMGLVHKYINSGRVGYEYGAGYNLFYGASQHFSIIDEEEKEENKEEKEEKRGGTRKKKN